MSDDVIYIYLYYTVKIISEDEDNKSLTLLFVIYSMLVISLRQDRDSIETGSSSVHPPLKTEDERRMNLFRTCSYPVQFLI